MQLDVDAQGVAEACGVDGDLLELRDVVASGQQLEELGSLFCDGAGLLQLDEFTEWVVVH